MTSLNTKFDSMAYQKEVESLDRKIQNRNKQFNTVFGDTARDVTGKKGVLKTAASILLNPGGYLKGIRSRYTKAKKQYPK